MKMGSKTTFRSLGHGGVDDPKPENYPINLNLAHIGE